MRALTIWGFILGLSSTLGPGAFATSSTSSLECGVYVLTGLIRPISEASAGVSAPQYALVLYPGSNSEFQVRLGPATPILNFRSNQTVSTRVQITQDVGLIRGRFLDAVPTRALPDSTSAAIQFLERTPCESRSTY